MPSRQIASPDLSSRVGRTPAADDERLHDEGASRRSPPRRGSPAGWRRRWRGRSDPGRRRPSSAAARRSPAPSRRSPAGRRQAVDRPRRQRPAGRFGGHPAAREAPHLPPRRREHRRRSRHGQAEADDRRGEDRPRDAGDADRRADQRHPGRALLSVANDRPSRPCRGRLDAARQQAVDRPRRQQEPGTSRQRRRGPRTGTGTPPPRQARRHHRPAADPVGQPAPMRRRQEEQQSRRGEDRADLDSLSPVPRPYRPSVAKTVVLPTVAAKTADRTMVGLHRTERR